MQLEPKLKFSFSKLIGLYSFSLQTEESILSAVLSADQKSEIRASPHASIKTASLNLRNPETNLSSGNRRSGQDGAHLGPETVLPRLQTHAEAHGGTAAASHRRGRPVRQFRHRFARPDILCVGENGRCELSGILPFAKLFPAGLCCQTRAYAALK